MKKLLLSIQSIIILFALISLSSCENLDLIGMKGSGPVVTRDIESEKVEGIILEIPATVYLTQGDVQSINIEAQENILNNINYYNTNGVLKIKFDQNVVKSEPIVVHMTIKSLKEATINGSGSIFTQSKFNTNSHLKISISGSGDIDLSANAKSVEMLISGSGNINLNSECESINGEINGSGDINLEGGYSQSANYYISGSGNINSLEFQTKSCFVETNGSGDIKVNVSEILNIRINGSGDVYYKGNPGISAKVNGSGDVINLN